MAEKAQPVVERPEAPATPAEDVPASPRASLAYTVAALPDPVSSADVYLRAILTEQRALRASIDRLVVALAPREKDDDNKKSK